ncbi:peptidase G2 autoproteolytic cleavage domain-containing protein [Pararhodobacter sp.]|uniref:peptidase G2 autoproteolytic cleavage domain-containing protein n=1 Tax=Pararhodobacter sp. TaxID=2127056 RepID=UPI002FDD76B0
MSEYSPRLNLPFIQQAQAQKHVTHNEAIERLDLLVQLVVEAFDASTPPALPEEGQIWALGAAPSGAWAGQGNHLAAWAGGGWLFLTPAEGWLATSAGELRLWNGAEWVAPLASDMQNLPGVGVNTNHDSINRLAVCAPATLLTHEGAGHQMKINKATAGDTASLLFQTDWSGRAELGTAGDDDFAVKVSADGSSWHTGLTLERATGNAVMRQVTATALTGTAVTQSDTDTTAGRVLRTGHRVYPALRSDSADTGAVSTSDDRAVIAAGSSRASGVNTLVGASGASHAAGDRNAIFGMSDGLIQNGNRNLIAAGNICTIDGANTSAILASLSCTLTASQAMILAGRRVINTTERSVALGDAGSGGPLSANRKIHLFAGSGNIQIAGSLTSSHTFSDFAEMFPNATGVEIPLGTIVTEAGGAVRPAGPGDEVAGVVTNTAVVTAGDTPFAWQGRYLSDEWGQPVMVDIPDPDHDGEGPAPMVRVQAENPDWDPEAPQIPRSQRPGQWTRVGLLGQVFTRVGKDVVPGDRLAAVAGIGVRSDARTGLRCMFITQPFDARKGYAVARCLINVSV